MAVSSSIGSNVFDVAVGLPLPWLVFGVYVDSIGCHDPVLVASDGLFESLLVLLVMVGLIVVTIALSNWAMTKLLGYTMFLFYVSASHSFKTSADPNAGSQLLPASLVLLRTASGTTTTTTTTTTTLTFIASALAYALLQFAYVGFALARTPSHLFTIPTC